MHVPPLGDFEIPLAMHTGHASVLHPACLRSFELLLRCPRPLASFDAYVVCAAGCPRSAFVSLDAGVVLAFSVSVARSSCDVYAFTFTFGFRRRPFKLCGRRHARLATT